MNENDNVYYNYEKKNFSLIKVIIIIVAVIALLFIIIQLLKPKNNPNNYYNNLVNEVKLHLDNNKDKYPSTIGECTQIKLSEISSSDKNMNKDCDKESTYVKVCKINENNYQFTPVLSCKNNKTEFNDWVIGEDYKQNNSDIEIKFIPEILKNGEKTYYTNKDISSTVQTYYTSAPESEYKYIESPVIAYQWYKEDSGKVYYKDGEHVLEAPKEYTEKEDKTIKEYGSTTKPNELDNRTISEGTIYSIEYIAYPYKYECSDSKYPGKVTSATKCEDRPTTSFTTTSKILYTCDGTKDVEKGTTCKARTEWTAKSCETTGNETGTTQEGYSYNRQTKTGYTCISTKGYIVKDEVWKWYYEGKTNIYYPSNEINAKTKSYYTKIPAAGFVKDETTTTYAYKYYNFKETNTSEKTWVSLTNKSVTEQEMIDLLKNEGYNVTSLKDIANNENIKYEIELSYRDRK